MLELIKLSVSEIYPFYLSSYGNDSVLKFGSRPILSQEGIQQDDSLGPLLFCLTIHLILRELSSPFIIVFTNDITIGDSEPLITSDIKHINTNGDKIGKCELINNQAS